MRNAGLEEAQGGMKTARRNINNLRYAGDTTLRAESGKELKSLLMKVKVESETIREKPFGSLPSRSFAGQFWPLVVRSTLFIYELLIYLSLFSLNSYVCLPENLTFLSGEPLGVLHGKGFSLSSVLLQEHPIPYFLCPSSSALLLCLLLMF